MKHLLSLALLLSLFACANAQVTTDKGGKSDAINHKISEVDRLIKLMPLILTKSQLNDKILPAIEKNRETLKKELAWEDDQLEKIESLLDDAIKGAYEKGVYPPQKVIMTVADLSRKVGIQQQIVAGFMVDAMIDVLKATLNAGQMKAMLGSFDPRYIDPTAKPEAVTDDRKMRFYVQNVFLDPITYDILKKLAKTAM